MEILRGTVWLGFRKRLAVHIASPEKQGAALQSRRAKSRIGRILAVYKRTTLEQKEEVQSSRTWTITFVTGGVESISLRSLRDDRRRSGEDGREVNTPPHH